jgi:hypothetical protein
MQTEATSATNLGETKRKNLGGRPRKKGSPMVGVIYPAADRADLERIAEEQGVTLSEVLRTALRAYMDLYDASRSNGAQPA